MIKLNLLLILSLFFFSSATYGSERDDMENQILKALAIDKVAEKAIDSYINETMRLYNLDREFLNEHFTDVFANAEKRYINSFAKGLSVYSDAELSQLLEFYNSDFGKWYLLKSEQFNSKSLEYLPNMMKLLNEEFAQRIKEVMPVNSN